MVNTINIQRITYLFSMAGTLNIIEYTPAVLNHFAFPLQMIIKTLRGSCEHQDTCWKRKPTNKGTTNR